MSVDIYKKKIEEYISKKESSKTELDSARGLLAPKTMNKEVKQQQDMISNISEFIYALRQKRNELKIKRGKK
jgi:hypothetical protein|tara:strand:- start:340 stop:555 length:216 start_codon:yes stop_codon:yes gene_type:complete